MESKDIAKNTKTRPSDGDMPPAKPGEEIADNDSANSSESMPQNFSNRPMANCEGDESSETNCEAPEMRQCDEEDENCEMPEMPSKMEGMGGPMGDGQPGQIIATSSDSILHPAGYLALGGCSVIVSMVIVYACFSKFFHLRPGQTFNRWQKFMWYCIVSIVLAAGLITLCYFVPIWING